MQIKWSSFYKLTEENICKYASRRAGVYLLWVELKNDKWICNYVGKAQDLRQRLLDHTSSEEPNECIRKNVSMYNEGFEFSEVGNQEDRDGIEKFLYDYYKPECNKNDPGGIPIEVNLS